MVSFLSGLMLMSLVNAQVISLKEAPEKNHANHLLSTLVHRRQVRETGRANFYPVGFVGAVGNHVHAKLALGGLDRGVNLTCGNMEAFGVKLEVVDQALHRGLHVAALRSYGTVCCGHRPGARHWTNQSGNLFLHSNLPRRRLIAGEFTKIPHGHQVIS